MLFQSKADSIQWVYLDSAHVHVIFTGVRYLNLSAPRGKWSLPARLSTGGVRGARSHANQ